MLLLIRVCATIMRAASQQQLQQMQIQRSRAAPLIRIAAPVSTFTGFIEGLKGTQMQPYHVQPTGPVRSSMRTSCFLGKSLHS